MNFFKDFKKSTDDFASLFKSRIGIPKRTWSGMNIMVSNCKLGDRMIHKPTIMFVVSQDDSSVTLRNLPNYKNGEMADDENEIDLDNMGEEEFVISLKDFYELIKPMGMQAQSPLGGI